jgi:hypothetical protein
MRVCQHCNKRKATRSRGLCHHCSQTPAIRYLYPVTSKYASLAAKGIMKEDFEGPTQLPGTPTMAGPGTEEKLAAMQSRLLMRVSLFHPTDGHERY